MSIATTELLGAMGVPSLATQLPSSELRFADGSECKIEIPSVEGPDCLREVQAAAANLDVPVSRVSQGSGVTLLTDDEILDMVHVAAEMKADLCLFARPCGSWGTSAMARSPAGSVVASCAYGQEQLAAAIDEIRRAAELGVRSVLISDLGVLSVFGTLRRDGSLPADMTAKVSVMLPAANGAAARVLTDLGADTINIPSDLSLPQIASIRHSVPVPLDIYIESPDGIGGFLRHHELPEIVRVAAPVHIKFGLRNAPEVYPSGGHLAAVNKAMCIERVRRARIGLDVLRRHRPGTLVSVPGQRDRLPLA